MADIGQNIVYYVLRDSPIAPLAWMAENLYVWTDGYPWTDNDDLMWVGTVLVRKCPDTHAYYTKTVLL